MRTLVMAGGLPAPADSHTVTMQEPDHRIVIGTRGEGEAVGVMSGLIPCPLALFVTTFAMSRGVPGAGVLFAVTMMAGVALTLSRVAVLSPSGRSWSSPDYAQLSSD
ncbi:MAG: hypothetical protein E5W94_28800 [Mesorhizobium sp.]|nr:MAG: hypothetical protein E5W94_28800 [Mesorhizobium sp.]